MSKQLQVILTALAIVIILALGTIAYFKFSTEDTWLCQNGVWVKHGNPNASMPTTGCGTVVNNNYNANNNSNINAIPPVTNPNIIVDFPQTNDELTSPVTITGSARTWYFEASFPVKLLDETGKEIAAVPAQAQGDWMTDQFVPFKATLEFLVAKDQNGTLVLMKDNPSGLPENDEKVEIPVKLKGVETMSVKVFFGSETKNPGALDCTKVFPVDRLISKIQTTAQAAIEELLKGPTASEIDQKFFTSINSGVKLQKITIKDGAAYADFDKTLEFQVGGSCRVAAIAAQITETLKQFSAIKNVVVSIDGRTEDILQP
ncbi:MAG: GerMN domain-containing protein [Candidatus Parcubacteria bacterium]|nr:GerMN domain-containing protein [Candidatus Parcubacteria bacterium]